MMNLRTTYLGFELPHPVMPGASPLVDDIDVVRRLEDAGAAALVLHSLFEEQIHWEETVRHHEIERFNDSHAEATGYFPAAGWDLGPGPDRYLEQVRAIKAAVGVPVIGSINGFTRGGWVRYAALIEEAGADALELNTFHLPCDPAESGADVEAEMIALLRDVRAAVSIPVALKLSPFFTALPHVAARAVDAGADGLVLFNRFYQPDLDPDELRVEPTLSLSDSSELRLRLRWLGILRDQLDIGLCASGGVHTAVDVVKAIMAGADAVQLVSSLLRFGPGHLNEVREGLRAWMEEHEFESIAQMRGCMSRANCPDPTGFERGNYLRILQSWKVSRRLSWD